MTKMKMMGRKQAKARIRNIRLNRKLVVGLIRKYITIPSLRPIIIMMFILAIGGIFSSDFGLFYQVSQGAQQPLTPVVATLDVKVYQMLTSGTISLGKTSAASLFQAVTIL